MEKEEVSGGTCVEGRGGIVEEASTQRKVYTDGFSRVFVPEPKLRLAYTGGKLEINDDGMQNIHTTEGVFDVSEVGGILNALLGRRIAVIPEYSGDLDTIFMAIDLSVKVPMFAAQHSYSETSYEGKRVFWLWHGNKLTVRKGNEWGYLEDVTHTGRSIKLGSTATPRQIQDGMNLLLQKLNEVGIYPNSLNPSDIARTEILRHCRSTVMDLTRGSRYATNAKVARTLIRSLQVYKAGYKDAPYVGTTRGYSDDEINAFGAALYEQHSLHPMDTDWVESTDINMLKTPSLVWVIMQADVTNLPTGNDIVVGFLRRRTKVGNTYSLTLPVMKTLPGQCLGLNEIKFVLSVGGRIENIRWATWFIAKKENYPFRALIKFLVKHQAELPILKMVLQRMAALMSGGFTIGHIPAHFWDDPEVKPWRANLVESLGWNEVMDIHSSIFMPMYSACVTERVAARTGNRAYLLKRDCFHSNTDGLEHSSPLLLLPEYGTNIGQLRHSEEGELYIPNDSQIDAPGHDTSLLRSKNISYKDLAIDTPGNKPYIEGPEYKYRRGLEAFLEGMTVEEAQADMAELITIIPKIPIGPPSRKPKKIKVGDTLHGLIYYEPLRTEADLYEHTKGKGARYLPE